MCKGHFTIQGVFYASSLMLCVFLHSCKKDEGSPINGTQIIEKVVYQPYFNGNPDERSFITQFFYNGDKTSIIQQYAVNRVNGKDTVVLQEIKIEYPAADLIRLKYADDIPGSTDDLLLYQELLLDSERLIQKSAIQYRRFPIGLYQEFREYIYDSMGMLKQSVAKNSLITENQSDGFKDMTYINSELVSCKTFPPDTVGIPYFSNNNLTYRLSYYPETEFNVNPQIAGVINTLSMPFHCLDISVRFGFPNIYLQNGQTSSLVKELMVDGTTSSPLLENTTSQYTYEKDSRGRIIKIKCYLTDLPRGKSNELTFEMEFLYKN
jgi:hypothetical protein